MPVPPQEAADALHDIEYAEQYSAAAYRYQKASPHLFLWGVVWMAGYAAAYERPQWSILWPLIVVFGIVAGFWITWRARAKGSRIFNWRYTATLLALALFVEGLFAIMPPKSGAQIGAFFPILIALCYTIFGIWTRATRIALLGVALGALTVGGYFGLPQYFLLWMAGVGGGALILGGLWFREI